MNRLRNSLSAVIALLAACWDVASAASPNIIVIFCDDLGYADLSCYGSKKKTTPHIDQMAAEGIDFQNFTVTAPSCSPRCLASLPRLG